MSHRTRPAMRTGGVCLEHEEAVVSAKALFSILFLALTVLVLRADSVVVFNEIHYHPATNEPVMEWVELHNQMAVNVDLSRWSIRNGIEYRFPEGSVIPGGGYLIVAASPEALRSALNLTNVLGPFTGRLANSGETLELVNASQRIMDRISYGVDGRWPVAPDGAGVTLAKRRENLASAEPSNWTGSALPGGTPGKLNFADEPFQVHSTNTIATGALWRYDISGTNSGSDWRKRDLDDSAWPLGAALFVNGQGGPPAGEMEPIRTLFSTGFDANGVALSPGMHDPHYRLVASAHNQPGPPPFPAVVVRNHPAWVGNSASGSWIGPVNPGTISANPGAYYYRTEFDLDDYDPPSASIALRLAVDNSLQDVLLNGVSRKLSYSGFNSMSGPFAIQGGFRAGLNTLEFRTWNEGSESSPVGLRVIVNGTARAKLTVNTRLPQSPVTSYFRAAFVVSGSPADTGAELRALLSDGAVWYLNGTEVWRVNMPPGEPQATTPAASEVTAPVWSRPQPLPSALLVPGTNILAVEVHSAGQTNDLVFAASLSLHATNVLVPPPVPVALNEIAAPSDSPFFVELLNLGSDPVELSALRLSRRGPGADNDYDLPAGLLEPGEFRTLSATDLGFAGAAGDRLFLFGPGGRVIDAATVGAGARARYPDGQGYWMAPARLTPAASNHVDLQTDIVINEIMYHAPPLAASDETLEQEVLVTFTNTWSFFAEGRSPAPAWTEPGFDDAQWASGPGLFYNSSAFLPVPKNTALPLADPGGDRIITWYFRTSFLLDRAPGTTELRIRSLIDDGALFYLNGREIYRTHMPAGEVRYDTLAMPGVATPVLGPAVTLAATNLVTGTNILAVEVHQFTTNPIAADVVFGAEVTRVHRSEPALPRRPSPEQWVELHNRGTNFVDLSGWTLDGDIEAKLGSGATIPPGGFAVLASDLASMRQQYPFVPIAGSFDKHLSHRSGMLTLRDPQGNPADEVSFYDAGAWPEAADGGGSSLELTDPRADNSKGGSWRASAREGTWSNFVYRAVATDPIGPTLWKEFVVGLLDAGECLLDDLRVVESPDTAPRDLLQNGDFERGAISWRLLGNHGGSMVEQDPDNPGNHVLRLVATGPTEHMHNHLETTLADGAAVVNGRVYEISFRAKWLSGNNLLNTRLYFNRVPRTTALPLHLRHGTPGARNSTWVANAGPTFDRVAHWPPIPAANQAVEIRASVSDPDQVSQVRVHWRGDNEPWKHVEMNPSGLAAQGYSEFTAALPGQPAGKLIQFYIEAHDGAGGISQFPPEGPNSRALFRVQDGEPSMAQLHRFRLLMTATDTSLLHAPTNVMSNQRFGATVVYDEREVFYNVGLRLQGSERGRNNPDRVGFSIRFQPDHLFRGVQDNIVIDRSGGPAGLGGPHEEILLWHAVNHASGSLLGLECDLVQVEPPRRSGLGTGLLRMSAFDPNYFASLFDGEAGELFTLELIYYPQQTVTGELEAPKLPQPDEVINVDLQDRGDDPESYRWIFLKENDRDLDDYAAPRELSRVFSLRGEQLQEQVGGCINVDQWMRSLAFKAFTGDPDTFTYGLNHNWLVQFPAGDDPALGLLWDMDLSFLQPPDYTFPGTGSAAMSRITALPDSWRRYQHHLHDLLGKTMNRSHLGPWASHYAGLLGEDWSQIVDYIQHRAGVIANRLPADAPFKLTSNNGASFGVFTNSIVLEGTAGLEVHELRLNGIPSQVRWTSSSNWTMSMALPGRINELRIEGFDSWGSPLAGASASIVVTNLVAPSLTPVVINEWMADNAGPGGSPDPLDGGFADWLELYNPNETAVDLGGYSLTDSLAQPGKWRFPAGTTIPGRGFLLVWADGDEEQNGSGPDSHAPFQLSRFGETIGLFSPDGKPQHLVTFGAQRQNVSEGLFPDGDTNSVHGMENWTPRMPNRLGTLAPPRIVGMRLKPDGTMEVVSGALPGRSYALEYCDDLQRGEWRPWQSPTRAETDRLEFTASGITNSHRFFRIMLVR